MSNIENSNTSPSAKDGDGVRVIEHDSAGSRSALLYKLFALVMVVCVIAYLVTMLMQRSSDASNTLSQQSVSDQAKTDAIDENDIASSSSQAGNAQEGQFTARVAAVQLPASRDPNDLSYYIAPGQTPKMEEVIDRLHEAGIHTGIGAFNPPGTSPPMIGLAVPDDYVLPEGYVRHFQATDDGQRIEPILMYSPDFEFFDSAGQPIAIPDNRVVPNNRAPPGLVIRPIKIPEPLEPGGP
jgi:hypothetical protein